MGSHLTVSIELVMFMKWLLNERKPLLDHLIDQALHHSLRKEIAELSISPTTLTQDDLSKSVRQFLSYIEHRMLSRIDIIESDEQKEHAEANGVDAASLLNLYGFDEEEVLLSARQTEHAIEHQGFPEKVSKETRKHLLMKNLLANWSPVSDKEIN